MPPIIPPRPRSAAARRNFAIVASQFNEEFVEGLISHATKELHALAPAAVIKVHRVPGAFEIPIIVRELAMQKRAEAIIALGVILKGDTKHADHLAHSVTHALQELALAHGVPVINAVLNLDDEQQARERCLEENINRGTEAARAALQIATTLAELRIR